MEKWKPMLINQLNMQQINFCKSSNLNEYNNTPTKTWPQQKGQLCQLCKHTTTTTTTKTITQQHNNNNNNNKNYTTTTITTTTYIITTTTTNNNNNNNNSNSNRAECYPLCGIFFSGYSSTALFQKLHMFIWSFGCQ